MGQREQVNYSSEAAQCQHQDGDVAVFGGGERLGGGRFRHCWVVVDGHRMCPAFSHTRRPRWIRDIERQASEDIVTFSAEEVRTQEGCIGLKLGKKMTLATRSSQPKSEPERKVVGLGNDSVLKFPCNDSSERDAAALGECETLRSCQGHCK